MKNKIVSAILFLLAFSVANAFAQVPENVTVNTDTEVKKTPSTPSTPTTTPYTEYG